jgi:hypothetical protein
MGIRRITRCFGLIRDGVAWGVDHGLRESTDAWYMHYSGYLCGNGKPLDGFARLINEGQITSMEADLDNDTLQFWVDGKPHGPGYIYQRGDWSVALGCEFDLQERSC